MSEIQYKTYRFMRALREEWNDLIAQNPQCHTPFQSYLYNKICYAFLRLRKKYRRFCPLIICFEDQGKKCIWPLIMDERGKAIYNNSHVGPMDYWDIISNSNDEIFHAQCMQSIKQKFAGYTICLENICAEYTESESRGRVASICPKTDLQEEACVQIMVTDYEDYYGGLSKHQRQNIRTAYNKLCKENIEITLKRYDRTTKHIQLMDYWKCMMMYEKRSIMKIYRNGGSVSRLTKLNRYKNMLLSASNISFLVIPERVMYTLCVKNEPVAYMAGFEKDGRYYVNRLSTSPEWQKYDMGIIMLDQLIRIAQEDHINIIDLTRGDEPYKMAMGGTLFYNYTYNA